MDFVIHACVGGLIGRAATPDERPDRSLVRLGALAALLPDADHALELVSANAYLVHHRTFSHSLLFAAIAAAAIAARPSPHRKRRAVVAGAALLSHLVLDLLTPYGTGITWPFTDHMLAIDGLQIIAPWLGLLCVVLAIVGTVRSRASAAQGRKAAWIGLGVLCAFLVLEFAVARRAAAAVEGRVVLAGPSWKMPLAGVAFAVEGTRLNVYRVSAGGEVERIDPPVRCRDVPSAHAIEAARVLAQRQVARLRVPVAHAEGATIVFEDAQFWTVDPGSPPFKVTVDPAAKTVDVHEQHRPMQVVLYLLVVGGVWFLSRGSRQQEASDHGDLGDR